VTALPNLLSLFRIAIVRSVVVLLMWTERGPRLAAAICFMIACITDYFDGWLARAVTARRCSASSSIRSPTSCSSVAVVIMLVAAPLEPRVPGWMATVIVLREIAVTGSAASPRRAASSCRRRSSGSTR
jgi:cardiolipin synthase